MAVAWTEEQKKVIDLRDRNLLVAAAAGSGKTAVLVERILSRITDPESPVNVDELLIVTFTRAAAAQMRDRIGQALKKRLMETPDNVHLQRQLTLLHYAQITTIDSFCNHIVRSHFDELDMDPDFRIGDEGELKLIRGDLIARLMEDHYASEDTEELHRFHELIETMAVGKGDDGIAELIEKLYFFVGSYPFPEKILEQWATETAVTDLEHQAWMRFLLEQLHLEAEEIRDQYDQAIRICMEADGPSVYAEMFISDRELADAVCRAEDYDSLQRALAEMNFMRKPVVRDKTVNARKKEFLSAFRDERKKTLQKWKTQYSFPEKGEMLRQWEASQKPLQTLCRLTAEFMERFAAYKKEKHLMDFTDLEHLALQILVTEEEGHTVPSAVARQLQAGYKEVMIDEYQDSNLVQELLLSSVAGHWRGEPNQFMVGDVKQSIYKFRMARPEIFMEKYDSYTEEESSSQKIDLHKKFRSRAEVLEAANFVFRQIMVKPLGGISYDDQSALYVGASFPCPTAAETERTGEEKEAGAESGEEAGDDFFECTREEERGGNCHKRYDYTTELMLVDLADEEGYRKEIDAKEAEAKAIGLRIRELTDPQTGLQIWDKELGAYRTARFGDVVILLRTFAGWAETFVNVLLNAGIPAYAQSSTGYFTALEVQTVLNCLRVLDNPMQDIPLAAVMHSPIGGFTSEEMAKIQAAFRRAGEPGGVRGLYGACLYVSAGDAVRRSAAAKQLACKLQSFLEQMETLRRKAVYLPLHELLQSVYDDTGYYELAGIMPDGAVRRANLDMLMEKAIAYEGTSYYGLFDFVRYIENLHKYDIDFGEAAPDGEGGDTVRITTIHKSKGLEYPIVFVAGVGKNFNQQDSRSRILMHPDLGLAADYVDTTLRLRTSTLKKQVLSHRSMLDNLGEELRVLYVAMTRAQEKLILTGTNKYLHRKLEKQPTLAGWFGRQLPSTMIAEAGSYLDWLLLCINRARYQGEEDIPIRLRIVHFRELLRQEVEHQVLRRHTREQLQDWDPEQVYDKEARQELEDRLHHVYAYTADETLPVKVSVSELKHAAMVEEAEMSRLVELLKEQWEPDAEPEHTLPRFLQETGKVSGASRGTVYHKILERLDFAMLSAWAGEKNRRALEQLLDDWQQDGFLTGPEREAVNAFQLLRFGTADVMRRMVRASAAGQLYRENPFVMGLPAGEVYPGCASEELVVIQGIIDVYWREEDGLCLLDYKTDRVPKDTGAQILKERYGVQMELYAKALEAATGLPVKEKLIYSFVLDRTISLE